MTLSQIVQKNHLKLTQEEILVLFEDREKNKTQLYNSQLALCLMMAKNVHINVQYDEEKIYDYFNQAIIIMDKCIQYYNPDKGVDFSSFCWGIIRQNLYRYQSQDKLVYVPRAYKEEFNTSISTYSQMGVEDEDYFSGKMYYEIAEDNTNDLLSYLRDKLSPKDYDILVGQFALDNINDKVLLDEIGEMYGCSKQNIVQFKKKIFKQLKNDKVFIDKLQNIIENQNH